MKKQIAYTLSLFFYYLLTLNVFGGGGLVAEPLLVFNAGRLLDIEARQRAFEARFGYHPLEEIAIVEGNDGLGVPEQVDQEEDLGIFGNLLQGEAALRLEQAQEHVDDDDDLGENMQAFAHWVNTDSVPPPPPPLPIALPNQDMQQEQVIVVPVGSSNNQNEGLFIAEQAMIAQQAMQKRREESAKKAKQDNVGLEIEKKEVEADIVKLPPSDPHMQALFEAVETRALKVEQQMKEEAERLAAQQDNEQQVVKKEPTEEELKRMKAEAEALKAKKEREAAARAKLSALKQNMLQGVISGTTLKKTTLEKKKKKKKRSSSFAGMPAVRVDVNRPAHSSLILDTTTTELNVEEEDLDSSDDSDELSYASCSSDSQKQEEEEKKKEEEQKQSSSWWDYVPSFGLFGGGNQVAVAEEIVLADAATPSELIWNEIAEIIALIDVGLPGNMTDSIMILGPGLLFMQNVSEDWGSGFHRYLYYPGLVRLIRERYEEANRIVAEDLDQDAIDPTVLGQMGDALNYIGLIIKGMDTQMQLHSTNVARRFVNPTSIDFLITEFPHFNKALSDIYIKLTTLYNAKGSTSASFDALVEARSHMIESMKFVESELNATLEKIELAQKESVDKPSPAGGLHIDD